MAKLGPLPDADHIIQAKSSGTHNGYLWVNIQYLQYTGALCTVADLQAVGNAVGNAWNTNFAPLCHANVTMNQVDLLDLSNRGAATATVTALAHPGTRAGTDVSNSVALVVTWKINHRYRGGHPRTYLPAGVTADITSGRLWAGAFQTTATTNANAYLTAINAISTGGKTFKMVGMNFYSHDPSTHAPVYVIPPVPYTIGSAVVHGRVDTQRRRLGKETP